METALEFSLWRKIEFRERDRKLVGRRIFEIPRLLQG
jgi:hypothetical protein